MNDTKINDVIMDVVQTKKLKTSRRMMKNAIVHLLIMNQDLVTHIENMKRVIEAQAHQNRELRLALQELQAIIVEDSTEEPTSDN